MNIINRIKYSTGTLAFAVIFGLSSPALASTYGSGPYNSGTYNNCSSSDASCTTSTSSSSGSAAATTSPTSNVSSPAQSTTTQTPTTTASSVAPTSNKWKNLSIIIGLVILLLALWRKFYEKLIHGFKKPHNGNHGGQGINDRNLPHTGGLGHTKPFGVSPSVLKQQLGPEAGSILEIDEPEKVHPELKDKQSNSNPTDIPVSSDSDEDKEQ